MKVVIVSVSDRASRGEYEDLSGPEIQRLVTAEFPGAEVAREVVPDEAVSIRRALDRNVSVDFILTTGGTGISPRDITPDVTADWCERLLPGVAETLRNESYRQTPNAMLSRGVAGIRGKTIVVNLPGSVNAVRFCTPLLFPAMAHAAAMLAGEGH